MYISHGSVARPTPPAAWMPRPDRRGRSSRSIMVRPHLPAWKTRRQVFDEMLRDTVRELPEKYRLQLRDLEFGAMEVPPSDPAPWEPQRPALCRLYPANPHTGAPACAVIYRRPVIQRYRDPEQVRHLLWHLVRDLISEHLGINPEEFRH